MKASEFAKMRGLDPRTVNKYLERHPELREDCKKEGNSLILGDYAERELSRIYPLPQPVIVGISEEEHRIVLEELSRAQKAMIILQNELTDQKLLNAENRANMMLLEDSQKRAKEDNQKLEAENTRLKAEFEAEKQKLEAELEAERRKTWFQKLVGR